MLLSTGFYLWKEIMICLRLGCNDESETDQKDSDKDANNSKNKESFCDKITHIFRYNRFICFIIIALQTFYCTMILCYGVNTTVDCVLPFINLLNWIELVRKLGIFKIV